MITAQGRKYDFLRRPRSLPGILRQLGCFSPSCPPPRANGLETHIQTKLPQLASDIFNRGLSLGRTHGTRADVLSDVRNLLVGVIVRQSGVANGDEFLKQCGWKRSCNRWFCTFVVGIDGNALLLGNQHRWDGDSYKRKK
jgi:hypothetical protein